MARKMTLQERMVSRERRTIRNMTQTVLRMMRDEDFRNNLTVDYSVAHKTWTPIIEEHVRGFLAVSSIRHIDIPRKVLAAL